MADTATVTINGLDPLLAKLRRLENIGETLRAPLVQSAEDVRAGVAKYPPQSEANVPKREPGGRWYERGKGTHYITKGRKQRGKRRTQNLSLPGGVERVYKTSEMLGRSWSIRYKFTTGTASATIGSRASYVRYVNDAEKQAGFHARRGWVTAQAVLKREEPAIVGRLEAAIDAELAK